jgi:hypothetical protein
VELGGLRGDIKDLQGDIKTLLGDIKGDIKDLHKIAFYAGLAGTAVGFMLKDIYDYS